MSDNTIIESFHWGHSLKTYEVFGAHFVYENGQDGVRFTVWAPHANAISVIGDFNDWNDEVNPFERTADPEVWSCFVANAVEGQAYKFRILSRTGEVLDKADPYAFYSEVRPNTASVLFDINKLTFDDEKWVKARNKGFDQPINIYEVHAGSWRMHDKNGDPDAGKTSEKTDTIPYTYDDLAEELVPYVTEHGYTHVEFMPLNEHPFDGSWGYQASGYFSCTSRYGTPDGFARLVNALHKAGIGVIMDIVPVHFVKDSHGLRYFDGEPLYEYPNPSDAESEWSTMNFDLWKEEVRSFLMSSANFWCDRFHVDGLRVDAVSNLIFWGGNASRGENEGALAFIRRMNYYLNQQNPGIMLIAEDSSSYPKVTHSTLDGGLGFDYKWDLGWMNDTLKYFKLDPVYRKWHHNTITFSMAYFYSEHFLCPLSHDEVVHGKATIINKMWGTYEEKFAQARCLYTYMMTHPGKKLNFMGNEIGMFREFDEAKELDWFMLRYPAHDSFLRFTTDLNLIYKAHPCLYKYDYDMRGFKWIDADDGNRSIYSYYREDENEVIVTVLNMTPVSYEEVTIGVPEKGTYTEMMNTEKDIYTGCNMCNFKPVRTKQGQWKEFEHTLTLRVAPFAGVMMVHKKTKAKTAKADTTAKAAKKTTTSKTDSKKKVSKKKAA